MTDIVHYLKHHGGPRGPEAAAEIEKLEATLDRQVEIAGHFAGEYEKIVEKIHVLADQVCEGWCEGFTLTACANIGADNCLGCGMIIAVNGTSTKQQSSGKERV